MDRKCDSCNGTGVYSGMAEGKGMAVVCSECKGNGHYKDTYEYEDFEGKKIKNGIKWVILANPGIGVGEGNGYKFSDFGGMSYKEWFNGEPFPPKSEMRKFTCPAWWYQGADYSKKPDWNICIGMGTFNSCKHFKNKEECWKRLDREQELKE